MVDENAPRVSIGVPVYNSERWLPRALDSLLAQDYPFIEIFVCDNASEDQTPAIAREYARLHAHVRFTENSTNLGATENFRRVLALADGKYFMWAAADDWWEPSFVSRAVQELESAGEAGVCMSAVRRVRESGAVKDEVHFSGRQDPAEMGWLSLAFATARKKYYYFYIYGLYRRRLLEAAFHSVPGVKGADHLFVAQIALATKWKYIDEVLYTRLVHDRGTHERYANEDIGAAYADRWGDWKRVAAAAPFLFRSEVIPRRRKIGIPIVVLGFALPEIRFELLTLLSRLTGTVLGPHRRARLGRFISRVARRVLA